MILLLLACGAPTLESEWVTGPTLTLTAAADRATANPFALATPFWAGTELSADMAIEVDLRMSGEAATVWAWMLTTGVDPTVPDVASPLAYEPVAFTAEDDPVILTPYTAGSCSWSDYNAVANSDGALGSGCSVGWQITVALRSGAAANVATRVRGIATFHSDDDVDLARSRVEAGWAP